MDRQGRRGEAGKAGGTGKGDEAGKGDEMRQAREVRQVMKAARQARLDWRSVRERSASFGKNDYLSDREMKKDAVK